MPSVLTRNAAEPVLRLRTLALPIAGAIAAAALFAGALRLVESPATVEGVTVENRTALDVEIAVSGEPGGALLPLGAVDPGRVTLVEEVLDQGSTWVFEVRSGGEHLGTIVRRGDRLADDGWRVVVPEGWEAPPASR